MAQVQRTSADLYLGIDIGGSSIKYGIGNCQHGLLFTEAIPVNATNLEEFRCLGQTMVERLCHRELWRRVAAIGIGSPGMIDQRQAKIIGTNPNLKFWSGCSPALLMPQSLLLPVFYENDANLMALAEAVSNPQDEVLIGITIGSGIGGGIVIGGKVFHGARGFAMEIGHTICEPHQELCNCGKRGCLEAYASLNGMRNRLGDLGIDAGQLNLQDILKRRENDPLVMQVVNKGIDCLAMALANLITILNPDALILGGGGSEIPEYPTELLFSRIKQYLDPVFAESVRLAKARLGNQAGVMGAIALAEKSIAQQ